MRYVWNREFDVFCLDDRVDFVAIDHEISFEGTVFASAMGKLISMLNCMENGFTFADVSQALTLFDPQDVARLWKSLLEENLLRDRELIVAQSEESLLECSESLVFEHFPVSLSDKLCGQIGFRFGSLYLLATVDQWMPASDFAKKILEWSFSGKWLDRARPLFWKTDERALAGERFLPLHTKKWLKLTLETLLLNNEPGCIYEMNLRSLEVKREQLLSGVSPVGVLEPVVQQKNITDCDEKVGFMPSFSIIQSRYRQPSIWSGARQCLASGAHSNPWVARHISTAEAVERSTAATYVVEDMVFGRLKDDSRRIDPRSFAELHDDQQADAHLYPFDPEKPYYWCDALELMSGRETQVIADLCYFPFHPSGYDHQFAWGNSSGMAAGCTLVEAQKSALFELIERDAFMTTWIMKRSAPHVSESLVPLGIRESRHKLELMGYETKLIDITVRGVPTVLGVAHRNEWPALVLGAAARNTLLEAAHAAWKEVEVGLYCRLLDPIMKGGDKPLLQAEDVVDSDDHAKFYNHPQNLRHASFLWSSEAKSERSLEVPFFKDLAEGNIVSLCWQLDIDQMHLVNYSNVCGFQVVRLLTPHLVPLTFGYNQLPWQRVAKSSVPGMRADLLSDAFPVHPFD